MSASQLSQKELGEALLAIHAGDLSRARAHLDRAVAADPADSDARYHRGLTHMRVGQWDAAAEDLSRVVAERAQMTAALFALGVCRAKQGREQEAADAFRRVAASDAALRAQARQQLEQLTQAPSPARRYRLYGSMGLEYDSNVALISNDDTLGDGELDDIAISDETDGRATFLAGATVEPVKTEHLGVSFSYELFQSLHFDLSEFDMQNHRLGASVAGDCGSLLCGAAAAHDYYLLDGDSFLHQPSVMPWVRHSGGRWGDTDVYYRFRFRDFDGDHFGTAVDEVRGGTNNAVGIRQTMQLGTPERFASVEYRYDHDDADDDIGEVFDYDGHLAQLMLGWALPVNLQSIAAYAYKREIYDSDGRRDNEHHFTLELRRPIGSYFAIVGRYRGTLNDSNEDLFEYDRHIAGVVLEASY